MLTHRLTVRSVRALAVPLLLAGLVTAIVPAASAAVRHPSDNSSRSIPNGFLYGVAATSGGRAWAVGQTLGHALSSFKTLTLRWGGSSWKRLASPNPSAGAQLNAVAATSAGNAWAVGNTNGPNPKPYIIHWNGTAWAHVPSPALAGGGVLFSVTATSSRNAWAVGCAGGNCFQDTHAINTLILHWNGSAWKRVPSPSTGPDSTLTGVAATSADNAWAVGCTAFCEINSVSPQTLILHWIDGSWEQVPSPATATTGALNGVTAVPGHAWAVGCTGYCFGPNATTSTMILAWNGTSWSQAPSPSPAGNSVLTSVAATSAGNAWAVGYTRDSGDTLIARWNGTSWRRVPSPTPRPVTFLLGVAAASASNAWAVGYDANASPVILLHWNGTTWQ
jgi:hypothetical protein